MPDNLDALTQSLLAGLAQEDADPDAADERFMARAAAVKPFSVDDDDEPDDDDGPQEALRRLDAKMKAEGRTERTAAEQKEYDAALAAAKSG
jgi:hypothetical protein